MKIKTINQIASTKTLTDKYGICSDENGNTNSFALADIVEPINNLKNEVGKIKVNGSGIESISYPELVALRNENKLVPGQMYRIIDYVTTTTQDETKSANHPFDIIVTALNENTLDEKASAIAHEEDTYFDGNDLSAWELWYDLDNDTTKYEWADATNGKGVIYRMIDDKANDCPYDFKNILFYKTKYTDNTTEDNYYYTFSYVVSGKLYDGTVDKQVNHCYSNSMGVQIIFNKRILLSNVFRSTTFGNGCYKNTFGNGCYKNTFGNGCYNNTFGDYCYNNTFGNGCNYNTFGNTCYSNTFGNTCYSNTFGNNCYNNTSGNGCNYNTFGNGCIYNTFGNGCNYNTFGNNCYKNTFGNNCYKNTFEHNCSSGHIDSSETSITSNDEYYDDGSDKLVPIKHPDLSTQPSILPYKFMGQYVYEQLIPVKIGDKIVSYDFIVEHPMILSAGIFGVNSFKNVDIIATKSDALLLNTESELEGYINVKYTDYSQLLPSNGYGYGDNDNNTQSPILIDFGLSSDGTAYTYDPNTEVLSLYKSGEITKSSIPQHLPKENIKNIILGNSVRSIGSYAFSRCDGLTSVTIGNGVKSINEGVFQSCKGLTSVTIGNSVTSIGRYAFQYCSGLTSVIFPNSVKSMTISDNAFDGCSGLTSVTIPNGTYVIRVRAFDGCSGLTSVTIPNSVTSIEANAFGSCSGLTAVHISDIAAWCNINFGSSANPLYYAHHLYLNGEEVKDLVIPNSVTSIGKYAFYGCWGLTSVTIPNSVTSIGAWVFAYCSGLTSVTIGNSVERILNGAFADCSGLTSITCEAIIPPTINSDTFRNIPTSISVYVPAESIDAYKSAQYWSNFTNIQAI